MKATLSQGSNGNYFLRVDGKLMSSFSNIIDAEYHKERYYFVYSIIGLGDLSEYYKYITESALMLIFLIRKSKLNKQGLTKMLMLELEERRKILYVINNYYAK